MGLLDTGAAVSVIGGNLTQQIIKSRIPFKRGLSSVSTADGRKHFIPSLSQDLYLGIDFCSKFELLQAEMQISEITSLTHYLFTQQQDELQKVTQEFPSFSVFGLGKTSILSHVMDIGDANPVKQRHFPVSPAVEKLLYAEIDRMLKLGVIKESDSAWLSPVVLVQKPGKVRLCLDSRKVNAVTRKDAYPLLSDIWDSIVGRLLKALFISSLDLKIAYWHIPLDPDFRDKTEFTIREKPLYQYKVMRFGLTNASQA